MSVSNLVKLKRNYQGIVVCVIIAIIAKTFSLHYQAPVMLFALLLGLALNSLYSTSKISSGVNACSSNLLRISVALLGVRIVFSDIVDIGLTAPLIIITAMVLTIGFGIQMARILKLPKQYGLLTGGAVAVCGVSAAAAISSVLPKSEHQEKFFALTVIGITTFSTAVMLVYPLIAEYLGLSPQLAGIFIGGTIHDVAQVVGAGYSVSETTGDTATYIKLLRVALLMPIVLSIFFMFNRKRAQQESLAEWAGGLVPTFLMGFIVLAIAKNVGIIPEIVVELFSVMSHWGLIIAMAAIGVKTSLGQVASLGWRPIALLASETIFIAGAVLLGIFYFL